MHRKKPRAGQRILTIACDDPVPCGPARIGVATQPVKGAQQPLCFFPGFAGVIGAGVTHRLDVTVTQADEQHTQPKATGQRDIVTAALLGLGHRDIDQIAETLARHPLMEQGQREPQLEFDNHRLLARATRNHIRLAHLTLYVIALPFKIGFDGGIKIGFAWFIHGATLAAFTRPIQASKLRTMNRDQINAFCASLPHTTHVLQWGNSDVWKVGGKLFAVCGWNDGKAAVTFKTSDIAFEVLQDIDGVRPAPYLASRGMKWLQDTRAPGLSDAELRNHIIYSYEMAIAALTKKKRAELGLWGLIGKGG